MPTYQYKCVDCEFEFEEFQSMSDDPLDTCPECGGHVERLITGGAGFLFKGSGFYITDYRSDSYKKSAEMDKPSPAVEKSSAKKDKTDTKSKSQAKAS